MCLLVKLCLVPLLCLVVVHSAPRKPRLSVAEENYPTYYVRDIGGTPGTYSYGYDITDPDTGNIQFRSEERYYNGTVVGSYGYVDATGVPQTYRYVADKQGYRVFHDPPNKSQSSPLVAQPMKHPGDQVDEGSSITWTRPKKNKKKPTNNILTKQPIGNKYVYGIIKPPSAYVEY